MERYKRGERGDVDDSTIALVEHGTSEYLTGPERSAEIGIEDGVPIILCHVDRWDALRDARAVDQDVDLAESVEGLGTEMFETGTMLDIARRTQGPARP